MSLLYFGCWMQEIFHSLLSFFDDDQLPRLIVQADGHIVRVNQVVRQLYHDQSIEQITDILPAMKTMGQSFAPQMLDCQDNCCRVSLRFCDNTSLYLLSLEFDGQSDWAKFSQMNQKLHDIYIELCQCDDEMDLYKQIVLAAREHLHIDRIGILLFADDQKKVVGTWGTNSQGELNDERELVLDNPGDESKAENFWISYALKNKNAVAVNYNHQLVDFGEYVGRGWNAIAAFWEGDKPTGWIACDNLFNRRPLPDWHREIIAELSRLTGQLVSKLRRQQDLRQMNEQLQQQVAVRTQELHASLTELKSAQEELVEAEKLASLGSLVAGVSHEINTPLGIALTASSFMQDMVKDLSSQFEQNLIKKSYLQEYIQSSQESSQLVVESLGRAAELVKSFKKLAVDQTVQIEQSVNLFDAVQNVIVSFKHNYKNRQIRIENNIPPQLSVIGIAGEYMQVFTNLLNNSLMHAFDEQGGHISIDGDLQQGVLFLQYQDNGKGVNETDLTKITQPFFTTKRNQGGTGLGLSIVHNIIKKMGGKMRIQSLQPSGLKFSIEIQIKSE